MSTATALPARRLPSAPLSIGTTWCPKCGEGADDLIIAPSGHCVSCASKANTGQVATPVSDPFWLLTPAEMEKAASELRRLAGESDRANRAVSESHFREDSPPYLALIDRVVTVDRERFLLHLLCVASRQYRR